MQKYELSLWDFEVLDKLMSNVLGHKPQQEWTAVELARVEQLKDRFQSAHTAWIETEE